jgi:hypothetical protein
MATQKLPEDEEMLALLGQMSEEELQELLDAQTQLEERLNEEGPKNDDELHAWLKYELNIDIPKVAVCPGHDAPFTFLADLFFERVEAAWESRIEAARRPFSSLCSTGSTRASSPAASPARSALLRLSRSGPTPTLRNWIYDEDGNLKPTIVSSLMRDTTFKNGSKIEVLGSTPDAVNGPHPQKAHADEVELMRDDTFRESRNMTVSKKLKDGRTLIPQDILTSTSKGPSGRVQQLIDEIEEAIAGGYKPPRKLYIWCIKETSLRSRTARWPSRIFPRSSSARARPSSVASGRMELLARSIRSAMATSTRAVAGSPTATS